MASEFYDDVDRASRQPLSKRGIDLDAIEARCAKRLAPAPWVVSESGEERPDPHGPPIPYAFFACGPTGSGSMSMEGREFEDAEFIAHAREDLPALVAEVRRLRDQRDTLMDKLDAATGGEG